MSDRIRLRPAHDAETLKRIYATPHQHTRWEDHKIRVAVTAEFARTAAGRVASAADLSCGDGAILDRLDATDKYYGDFAPAYDLTGPLEDTIQQIPNVDLYICCETLEHLDDPDEALRRIRMKSKALVLSTPVDAFRDSNVEHYWAWSRAGVEVMLAAAGFQVSAYTSLDFRPRGPHFYQFGVWYCR